MSDKHEHSLNVAIFAHNEEDNIERCILSVIDATTNPERLRITVLINGTKDATMSIVLRCRERFPQVFVKDIALGDKSNAWNEYVYDDIDIDGNHYFMDGDNWLPSYCLDKLEGEFDTSKYWGIAPIPLGVSEDLRDFLISNKFISGNLYGVSGEFLQATLESRFKLPVGFIGDDSLVMYMLQEGFGGLGGSTKTKRIKVIESTGPVIPRIKIGLRVLSFMHNRYKRYAIRHFQQEIFYYLGREGRLGELPINSSDCKKYLSRIGLGPYLKFCGMQTLYHPYALIRMLVS